MTKPQIGILIINIFVVGLVVIGFLVGGNPIQLKDIAADMAKMNSFSMIESAIQQRYDKTQTLPQSLSDLDIGQINLSDPITKKPYEYRLKSATEYELCADFKTDSNEMKSQDKGNYFSGYYNYSDTKLHQKGHDCLLYAVNQPSLKTNQFPVNNRATVVEQQEGNLFFPVDARFDFNPTDSPNLESGVINSGHLKLLISPTDTKVYSLKSNPNEYLVQLYGLIGGENPYANFEKACFHQPNQVNSCGWNLQQLDLVSSNSTISRRNLENSPDYVVKNLDSNLPTYGNFSTQSDTKNLYTGAIYFYVRKAEFAPNGQVSKFTLKGLTDSANTKAKNELTVNITII